MKEFIQALPFSTIIGFVAGILTAISMLPQLIKTLKEKKAEEVSPVMLVVLISGVLLWIVYGAIKKDFPILITNSISFLLNLWMFFLRKKYKDSKR
ncbi:MAG: SemiSWEET transporter [Ferruginibacter sp.]|nr:SemiSWEET transporter [Ferruginibacter sp.]